MSPTAHVRIARASDDLAALVRFYRDGLGFEQLSSFQDPGGYRVVLQNAVWID